MNLPKLIAACEHATDIALGMMSVLIKEWQSSDEAALQLALDLSTFECNKPIVAAIAKMGNSLLDLSKVDTNSERRLSVLFPVGTILSVRKQHDKHHYPLNELCMVTRYVTQAKYGKTYMRALRQDGTEGDLIYIYDILDPAFQPEEGVAGLFWQRLDGKVLDLSLQPILKVLEGDPQ